MHGEGPHEQLSNDNKYGVCRCCVVGNRVGKYALALSLRAMA